MQLSETPPAFSPLASPFWPYCARTAAPAGANSLSWSGCAFPQRERSLRGLQPPSASPRGAVTTHTAPWGRFPKRSSQPWALTVSGRLRLPRACRPHRGMSLLSPPPPRGARGQGGPGLETGSRGACGAGAVPAPLGPGDANGAAPQPGAGAPAPQRRAATWWHREGEAGGRVAAGARARSPPTRVQPEEGPRFPFPPALRAEPRRSSPASRGCGFPAPCCRGCRYRGIPAHAVPPADQPLPNCPPGPRGPCPKRPNLSVLRSHRPGCCDSGASLPQTYRASPRYICPSEPGG